MWKRFTLVASLVGLTTAIIVHAFPAHPAPAVLTAVAADPPVIDEPPAPVPALTDAMPPIESNPLYTYVLNVMNGWPKALPILPAVPYEEIAADIARVAQTPQDAVLAATLGYFEGARYARYVDSGQCNDMAFMKTPEGQRLARWGRCDSGHAYTIFQIHPFTDKHAVAYEKCNKEVITASRANAVVCALEIAHRSLARTGTLVDYTGEWRAPSHPLADIRLSFARRASTQHPYTFAKPFE